LTAQADGAADATRFEVASITPHRDDGSVQAGFDENPVSCGYGTCLCAL
jgi:hypothetical protein